MKAIETNRLILRKPKKSDSKGLFSVFNDATLQIYIPTLYCSTMKDVKRWIDLTTHFFNMKMDFALVIQEINSKEIIGVIHAYSLEQTKLSISYVIKSDKRGHGYMVEAIKCLIKYLYNQDFFTEILFDIRYDNVASIAIMKKLKIPKVAIKENYFKYSLSLQNKLSF